MILVAQWEESLESHNLHLEKAATQVFAFLSAGRAESFLFPEIFISLPCCWLMSCHGSGCILIAGVLSAKEQSPRKWLKALDTIEHFCYQMKLFSGRGLMSICWW
mgnify:FL=1